MAASCARGLLRPANAGRIGRHDVAVGEELVARARSARVPK
jgi:hypothetical protein